MGKNLQTIQFIQVNPEELKDAIIEGVKHQLKEFQRHFKPIEPNEYISRLEVSKWLGVNESTVHNWRVRGTITAYQLEGRVFFKRKDIENAMIKLEK